MLDAEMENTERPGDDNEDSDENEGKEDANIVELKYSIRMKF